MKKAASSTQRKQPILQYFYNTVNHAHMHIDKDFFNASRI